MLKGKGAQLLRPLTLIVNYQREIQHLKQVDAKLGEWIERLGPCTLKPGASAPFAALCASILYQQLSGKAAATITARFKALYGGSFPSPAALLDTKDEALRGAGISRSKLLALKDLAQKSHDGSLNFKALPALDDEAIIDHLTRVRGIGRWTAQMFLMFTLGRLDVFPSADLGIQKAVQQLYGYKKLPAPRTMNRHGNRWKPYRTLASWYLWKLVD